MNYQELTIDFVGKTADGEGYNVKVDSSLGYSAEQEIIIPEGAFDNASQLDGMVRGETRKAQIDGDITMLEPDAYGEQLFEALFTGDVRRVYDKSSGSVTDSEGSGLRIKLQFSLADGDAKLAEIPWELMRDAAEMQYLSLNRRTPIVRYVNAQQRLNLEPLHGPLRVLVVMASPSSEAQLDLDREKALIEKSWAADPNVEVTFLQHATKRQLQETIPGYHVMHYMGHGVHSDGGGGSIVLEDDDGNADLLDADRLGQWVKGESLRLVVLNACETAKSSEGKPFASVAPRLVMAGVPAVIAMQFPISDDAAIDFSTMFYNRLVLGDPVDEATARGRGAISAGAGGDMEWGTPVLFMRAPNGQLFSNNTSGEMLQSTVSGVTPVSVPPPDLTVSGVSGVSPVQAAPPKKGTPYGLIAGGVVLALVAAVLIWIITLPEHSFEFAQKDVVTSINQPAQLMLTPMDESFSASDFRDYVVDVEGDYALQFDPIESMTDGWRISPYASVEGRYEVKARVVSTFELDGLSEAEQLDVRNKTPWIRTTVQVEIRAEALEVLNGLQQQLSDRSVLTEDLYRDIYDYGYADQLGSKAGDYQDLLMSMSGLYEAKTNADDAAANRLLSIDYKAQAYSSYLDKLAAVRGLEASESGEGSLQRSRLQRLQTMPRLESVALCTSGNFCSGQSTFTRSGIYPAIVFPPAYRGQTLTFEIYSDADRVASHDFVIENNSQQYGYFRSPGRGNYQVVLFNSSDDMLWQQAITIQ